MLLAYQGLHVAVLLLMGGYLLARSWRGRLQPQARATLDNTLLMWHCASVQGVTGCCSCRHCHGCWAEARSPSRRREMRRPQPRRGLRGS